MTIRANTFPVPAFLAPRHVLVSVYDKSNLDTLVHGLFSANPQVHFYSTGGTGKRIVEILGGLADTHYTSVESFTCFPEMDGGLVKTLHPKIHAGLLGERNNPQHLQYLQEMADKTGSPGVFFDVMVGNLYPFQEIITKPGCTPEEARINIDIGGPTMIMAAAKNWHSVAVLTSPSQYRRFLDDLEADGGSISLPVRFSLTQRAMRVTADYRTMNADYFSLLHFERDVLPGLRVEEKT